MTAGMVGTAAVGVVVVTHRARDRIAACLAPVSYTHLTLPTKAEV